MHSKKHNIILVVFVRRLFYRKTSLPCTLVPYLLVGTVAPQALQVNIRYCTNFESTMSGDKVSSPLKRGAPEAHVSDDDASIIKTFRNEALDIGQAGMGTGAASHPIFPNNMSASLNRAAADIELLRSQNAINRLGLTMNMFGNVNSSAMSPSSQAYLLSQQQQSLFGGLNPLLHFQPSNQLPFMHQMMQFGSLGQQSQQLSGYSSGQLGGNSSPYLQRLPFGAGNLSGAALCGSSHDAQALLRQAQNGAAVLSGDSATKLLPPLVPTADTGPLAVRVKKRRRYRHESFPEKLYRMIEELEAQDKDDIISFVADGRAIAIHRPDAMEAEIIPSYFRHTKLSSFKRQLSMYGFQRITSGPLEGAFEHPMFRAKAPELCRQMKRVTELEVVAAGSGTA